jgi:O-antigen/teichoic acid export membrane protein
VRVSRTTGAREPNDSRIRFGLMGRLWNAKRAQTALATNAMSSVGNLCISVAIARSSSSHAFGQYAVAFAVYLLATGLLRAAIADSILSQGPSHSSLKAGAARTIYVGIAAGLFTAVAAYLTSSAYLGATAVCIPGIVLYDYIKVTSLGIGNPRRAFLQELSWTILSAGAATANLLGLCNGTWAFALWAGSCSLIGFIHGFVLHYRLLPKWHAEPGEGRVAGLFGLDFLIGSGVGQVTTMLLAGVAGTAVVGALRGGGTALAPVSLIAGTAPALLIPHVSRTRLAPAAERTKAAINTTLVLLALSAPLLILVSITPGVIGRAILGATWPSAHPLLPALACGLFFEIAVTVPFAGHRVERVGSRTLTVRVSVSIIRIATVLVLAHSFGAGGAATAIAITSFASAATWWVSYLALIRSRSLQESGEHVSSLAATPHVQD